MILSLFLVLTTSITSQQILVLSGDTGAFFNQHELKKINHLTAEFEYQQIYVNELSDMIVMQSDIINIQNQQIDAKDSIISNNVLAMSTLRQTNTETEDFYKEKVKNVRGQRNKAYGLIGIIAVVIVLLAM